MHAHTHTHTHAHARVHTHICTSIHAHHEFPNCSDQDAFEVTCLFLHFCLFLLSFLSIFFSSHMIFLEETIVVFVFAAQSETNIEAEVSLDVGVVS